MILTEKCKDDLIAALQRELDTRDKRFMFIKICFKEILPNIDLEGSPRGAAWNIYSEFQKQQMLGSLIASLNTTFDLYLRLDFIK